MSVVYRLVISILSISLGHSPDVNVSIQWLVSVVRARQVNHARNIWDRAITILPRANQFWYKYTYMEEMLGNIAGCRQVHTTTNSSTLSCWCTVYGVVCSLLGV